MMNSKMMNSVLMNSEFPKFGNKRRRGKYRVVTPSTTHIPKQPALK